MAITAALIGVLVECLLINYIAGRKCRKRIAILEQQVKDLQDNPFIELGKTKRA